MREAAAAVAVGRWICKEKQGGFVGFKRRVKRTKIKGKGGEGRSRHSAAVSARRRRRSSPDSEWWLKG